MISAKQQLLRRLKMLPRGYIAVFVVKQAWAALFGGLLLLGIVVTHYIDLPWLARYDWLFVWAIAVQAGMLAAKLEQPREVLTIFVFHLLGLMMELFKTSAGIGSWVYPEENTIRLATVPLFSGFMYAAVGSYLARAWRVLDLRFTRYPSRQWTIALIVAVYINFYTHHYIPDARVLLFLALGGLFWRTKVHFRLIVREHTMPLLVGFGLIAAVIWIAENIATYTKVWLYPAQYSVWQLVGVSKFGSWLLLMVISFVLVEVLHARYGRRAM